MLVLVLVDSYGRITGTLKKNRDLIHIEHLANSEVVTTSTRKSLRGVEVGVGGKRWNS